MYDCLYEAITKEIYILANFKLLLLKLENVLDDNIARGGYARCYVIVDCNSRASGRRALWRMRSTSETNVLPKIKLKTKLTCALADKMSESLYVSCNADIRAGAACNTPSLTLSLGGLG